MRRRDAHNARLDSSSCPKTPLVDESAILHVGRPEGLGSIAFGEIEINCKGLPKDESTIVETGNVTVGVDTQIIRRTALGVRRSRYMLVRNINLLEHPQ